MLMICESLFVLKKLKEDPNYEVDEIIYGDGGRSLMFCQCTFVPTTANDRDNVIQWIELFQADCLVRGMQMSL